MNEPHDDLSRLLRPPVDPLAAPPGAFERTRRAARRRRLARVVLSAGAAVLIVAAGVPGTLYALRAAEDRTPPPPAVQHTASRSASDVPSPAETPGGAATPGGEATPDRVGPPGGPVPPGFVPESVTFVSQRLGWALGQAPCSDPPCTSVVRTEDGGHTWDGIPAPRTGGGDRPGGVSGVRFADARNGWAYGPGLWSTHDGGATWHRVGAPGGGRVLALAAAGDRVVAAVSTCGKRERCDSFRVYGTPDGADRWRPLPGAQGSVGSAAAGLSLTVRGGSAYLAGGPPDGSAIWSGPVDGGGEWVRRDAPCEDEFYPSAVTSASNGELVLVCAGRPAAGSQPKIVYLSGDGTSWERGGEAPAGGLVTAAAATPAKIFVATNHGLVVSADGGRQWRRDLVDRNLTYVGFTTARQGVLVPAPSRPGELLFSYDAGRTWSPVRFR